MTKILWITASLFFLLANVTFAAKTNIAPYESKEIYDFACNKTEPLSCGSKGVCDVNVCRCYSEFATRKEDDKPCTWERKEKTTALILHIFIGFLGGSAWYMKWYTYATLQLVVIPFLAFLGVSFNAMLKKNKDTTKSYYNYEVYQVLGGIVFMISLALWITTFVYIVDKCVDSNGVSCI